ncbi:hypothetical protein V2J09_015841 [Rumex salicifolius]
MVTTGTDYEKEVRSPPASKCKGSTLDAFLRVVLLAASVAAVVVMVTSNQNKVYFVVALSTAGLYSIITGLASFMVSCKPCVSAKWLLILIINDALMLGIVASATGTAGSVAYLGLKGNTHVGWGKICDKYGKFCRHVGSSVAVSLVAAVVLLLLIFINACALSRAVHRRN